MRIVDLFSGAGGLTFGFYYNRENNTFVRNENCNIIFANEYDHAAAESFRINFPDINMINQDIVIAGIWFFPNTIIYLLFAKHSAWIVG